MNNSAINNGLFGKTRQAVLNLLFGEPDKTFYISRIMDNVKTGHGAVQRELKNLTDAGIISRTVEGRQVYYRANNKCPFYNELRELLVKLAETEPTPDGSMLSSRFPVSKDKLAEFCRKHHIDKLSVFGSALRDDFGPESDIDVLVEFKPGFVPGFGIIDIQNELSKLAGRRIDLRTPKDLSRYFRDSVIREAKVEYSDV
jgi:predicted nucleotidyltransferase